MQSVCVPHGSTNRNASVTASSSSNDVRVGGFQHGFICKHSVVAARPRAGRVSAATIPFNGIARDANPTWIRGVWLFADDIHEDVLFPVVSRLDKTTTVLSSA